MFEKEKNLRKTGVNTIIKIDGANRFVDITQAFGIGKIKLAFREYNKDKAPGERTSRELDCYLSIEDASYLANLCTTRTFISIGQHYENRRAESNYDYAMPIFESYTGKEEKDSQGRVVKTISRHLTLSRKSPKEGGNNTKIPYTLKLEEGPGVKTQTGAYMPDKNAKGGKQYIPIGMSVAQVVKLGLALERAINIYDTLVATDLLERRTNEIREISKAEANEKSRGYGYNNNDNGNGYNNYNNTGYSNNDRNGGYAARPNPTSQPDANNGSTRGYVAKPAPARQAPGRDNGEISGYVSKPGPATQTPNRPNENGEVRGYVSRPAPPTPARQAPSESINGYGRNWQ